MQTAREMQTAKGRGRGKETEAATTTVRMSSCGAASTREQVRAPARALARGTTPDSHHEIHRDERPDPDRWMARATAHASIRPPVHASPRPSRPETIRSTFRAPARVSHPAATPARPSHPAAAPARCPRYDRRLEMAGQSHSPPNARRLEMAGQSHSPRNDRRLEMADQFHSPLNDPRCRTAHRRRRTTAFPMDGSTPAADRTRTAWAAALAERTVPAPRTVTGMRYGMIRIPAGAVLPLRSPPSGRTAAAHPSPRLPVRSRTIGTAWCRDRAMQEPRAGSPASALLRRDNRVLRRAVPSA